jgi:hypothetical protein
MKNAALIIGGLAVIILLVASCSDDSPGESSNLSPDLLRITPAEGASSVPTETSIHMAFNMPMDTQSVRMYTYFSGGELMHEWMDSLDHYGGMGHMNMNRMDHMIVWIDSIEWGGRFHWNENLDSCEFMPDSTLHYRTDYMIMFNENGIMGHNGMGMHMGHYDEGYHYYHFHTEDMPAAGSGF